MSEPYKLIRVASLKTADEFRRHLQSIGAHIPCDDVIEQGPTSPMAGSVAPIAINGRTPGNRVAIQPMEGWDATQTGAVTAEVIRRWERFGESGAKLIYGGEAMAVRPDGRANPNQLILSEANRTGIAGLVRSLRAAHLARYGSDADLVIGFQLTHSGRFCKPIDNMVLEPRVAFRHPILDRRFGVESDSQIFTDEELDQLTVDYVTAARVAASAGADFVDIKHCHGYLLHELLGAHTRPGKYGGTFENRTRFLKSVVEGIRSAGLNLEIGVRLSAFDFVPFRPDPERSTPGKPGPGIPEDFSHALPYRYGFGVNPENPLEYDLTEPFQFVDLCREFGVKILNLSAGSPYYNPHIQRAAAYPPSDGYQPAHDPLIDVARQIEVVRQMKLRAGPNVLVVGSGYSYLQEFLPHVAQAVLRDGWVDCIGIGRMVLSYPAMMMDAIGKGVVTPKLICRTFSDCTTAPRNGIPSGCYPLDPHYAGTPDAARLKQLKRGSL